MTDDNGPTRTVPSGAGLVLPRRKFLSPILSGQEYVLLVVVAVVWVLLGIFTPAFLSSSSIGPLFVSVAPIALAGVGMTFVIITAGIDVSTEGVLLITAVVVAKLMVAANIPLSLIIVVALVCGAILGAFNGLIIATTGVHPIIITFATWNIFLFIGYAIFNSSTVNNIPSTLDVLGPSRAGTIFNIPIILVVTLIAVAVAWWVLRYTRFGRSLYAIGNDTDVARLAGVRVRTRLFTIYLITGALTGLGACAIIASGTSTLDQSVGRGDVLLVIAAVVIGGTSIVGGRGSVIGTFLGAVLVQSVINGVTQLGWPSQLSSLFVGIFIVIAVGVDTTRAELRKRQMRRRQR